MEKKTLLLRLRQIINKGQEKRSQFVVFHRPLRGIIQREIIRRNLIHSGIFLIAHLGAIVIQAGPALLFIQKREALVMAGGLEPRWKPLWIFDGCPAPASQTAPEDLCNILQGIVHIGLRFQSLSTEVARKRLCNKPKLIIGFIIPRLRLQHEPLPVYVLCHRTITLSQDRQTKEAVVSAKLSLFALSGPNFTRFFDYQGGRFSLSYRILPSNTEESEQ